MSPFLKDIGQAIHAVRLELFVTIIILLLLFFAAVLASWLSRRSGHNQLSRRQFRHRGLRRTSRHSRFSSTALNQNDWLSGFWLGISTELVGAIITTLSLGMFVLISQQYQSIQNRKAQLILQMGSPDNGFAVEAARQLGAEGWLYDGILQDVNLDFANLHDVDLVQANLQGAVLFQVNLQGAVLGDANLQDANLSGANLQDADLRDANLQNTDLSFAKLQGAVLSFANLQGTDLSFSSLQDADLRDANLQGANVEGTEFDEKSVLPDATLIRTDDDGKRIYDRYWTLDTDMSRYTDPKHPNFWNPCTELDPLPSYCNE